MNSTISLLLVFLNQFFMPRHNAQLILLKAQIAILRARIPRMFRLVLAEGRSLVRLRDIIEARAVELWSGLRYPADAIKRDVPAHFAAGRN